MKTIKRNLVRRGLNRVGRLALYAVFAATVITARAQNYFQVARGGTENIRASTNQVYSITISTAKARLVAIEERFQMCSSATDAIELHFDGTLTGSSWIADALGSTNISGTGTTAITNVVLLDSVGYIGIRLRMVNGSSTVAITNIWLAGTLKTGNISATTLTGISESAVTNADLTASRAMVTDANKAIASSATTAAELAYVHNVTSAIQTQLNTKGGATNGNFQAPVLTNAVLLNPVFIGATNKDLTASRAMVTDANDAPASSAVTATELGYLSGVTSSVQGQLNSVQASNIVAITSVTNDLLPTAWNLVRGSRARLTVSVVGTSQTAALMYSNGVSGAVRTYPLMNGVTNFVHGFLMQPNSQFAITNCTVLINTSSIDY